MCRGIEDPEVQTIKRGLQAENTVFYLSRLYVPLALFSLYRKGFFADHFTFMELKSILRIAVVMHLIDIGGHALMRKITWPVVDKYVGQTMIDFESKKKSYLDDYLLQKDYFKNKKEASK